MKMLLFIQIYIIGMGEELQEALKDIEAMKTAISEKIEKMQSKVTGLIAEIDNLTNKFKDRTEKFIEDMSADELKKRLKALVQKDIELGIKIIINGRK
jgi:predicted nuclease with TOPRIM domain